MGFEFLKPEVEEGELIAVYSLRNDIRDNISQVELTQKVTLDAKKPRIGLKGMHGLFASPEWWRSIEEGRIPLLRISGLIRDVYMAGQDESGDNDTIDIEMTDGSTRSIGIYVNRSQDAPLFQVGKMAWIVYALDELKAQPSSDGGVNYSRITLEMAVSR
jgi:hypothetical protein